MFVLAPRCRPFLIAVALVLGLSVANTDAVAGAYGVTKDDLASLLLRSRHVVLADVLSLRIGGRVRTYEIKVIEMLKGEASGPPVLRLPLHPDVSPSDEFELFNSKAGASEQMWHASAEFWLRRSAPYVRVVNGVPDREVRKGRFLIFADEPFHVNAWEPIFQTEDPWYLTVKAMIADPGLQGRSLDGIEFLKMFPAVYLAQCGHPEGTLRPGLIWGHDVALAGDPKPDYPNPGPCEARKGESFFYLSLFFDVNDMFSIAVPIDKGTIRFAARYGDIVIDNRDVHVADAIENLAGGRKGQLRQ